jgi:hypothetical protein
MEGIHHLSSRPGEVDDGQQIRALSLPDLQAAADELLDQLRVHTRRRLDDGVAVLLAELTLTHSGSALQPAASGQWTVAGVTERAA